VKVLTQVSTEMTELLDNHRRGDPVTIDSEQLAACQESIAAICADFDTENYNLLRGWLRINGPAGAVTLNLDRATTKTSA